MNQKKIIVSAANELDCCLQIGDQIGVARVVNSLRPFVRYANFSLLMPEPTDWSSVKLKPSSFLILALSLIENCGRIEKVPVHSLNLVLKNLDRLPLYLRSQALAALLRLIDDDRFFNFALVTCASVLDVRSLEQIRADAYSRTGRVAHVNVCDVIIKIIRGGVINDSDMAVKFFPVFPQLFELLPHLVLLPPQALHNPPEYLRALLEFTLHRSNITAEESVRVLKVLYQWDSYRDIIYPWLIEFGRTNADFLIDSNYLDFYSGLFFKLGGSYEELEAVVGGAHSFARGYRLLEEIFDKLNNLPTAVKPQLDGANSGAVSPDEVEFHALLWGKDTYFQSAIQSGLPSLLQTLSFRRLKEQRKIRFVFHTTEESLGKFSQIIKALSSVGIEYEMRTSLGKTDASGWSMRVQSFIEMLLRGSELGSTIVGFCPDAYYGEGIDHLIENCPAGGASYAPHIRVSERRALELLTYERVDPNEVPYLSNLQLLEMAFTRLFHPVQLAQFGRVLSFNGLKYNCSDMAYRYMSNRALCWVFRPNSDFIRDYFAIAVPRYNNPFGEFLCQPVDHGMANLLMGKNLLYKPSGLLEFVCLEFSKDNGYLNFSKGVDSNFPPPWMSPIEIPVELEVGKLIDDTLLPQYFGAFSPPNYV